MKKTMYTCVIIFVIFVFSGCSKAIDLTDEENYLIAEYRNIFFFYELSISCFFIIIIIKFS